MSLVKTKPNPERIKPMAHPLIHISKMTGKLDGFQAISTNTMTNEYCVKQNASGKADNICTKCYSHTMLKTYRKNMAPALERNSVALSTRVIMGEDIPRLNDAYFRLDAHGELINTLHLENLLRIARANPQTTITLWTKRKDIVNKVLDVIPKPSNMILVFSNSKIGTILDQAPKHFDKTFNNVLVNEHTDRQNCTGQKCMDCLKCYTHNDTVAIVEAVKKY